MLHFDMCMRLIDRVTCTLVPMQLYITRTNKHMHTGEYNGGVLKSSAWEPAIHVGVVDMKCLENGDVLDLHMKKWSLFIITLALAVLMFSGLPD